MEILFLNNINHIEAVFLFVCLGVIFLILATYLYEYIERIIQIFGPKKRDAKILSRDEDVLKKRDQIEEENPALTEKDDIVPPVTVDEILEVEENLQKEENNQKADERETVISENSENEDKNDILEESSEIFDEKNQENYDPIVVSEGENPVSNDEIMSEKIEESNNYKENFEENIAHNEDNLKNDDFENLKNIAEKMKNSEDTLPLKNNNSDENAENVLSEKLEQITQNMDRNTNDKNQENAEVENIENQNTKTILNDENVVDDDKNYDENEKLDNNDFNNKNTEENENSENSEENENSENSEENENSENSEENFKNTDKKSQNLDTFSESVPEKTFDEIEKESDEEFQKQIEMQAQENDLKGDTLSDEDQKVSEIISENTDNSDKDTDKLSDEVENIDDLKHTQNKENEDNQKDENQNNEENENNQEKIEKTQNTVTDETDNDGTDNSVNNAKNVAALSEETIVLSENVEKSLKSTEEVVNKIIDKTEKQKSEDETAKDTKKHFNEKLFTLVNQVETLLARGLIQEAKMLTIEGLSLDKNQKELNLILAEIYEGENDFDKAEIIYKDIAEKHSEDIKVLSRLANLLIIKKNTAVAYEMYKKILSLGGDDENALYILSHLAREIDDMSDVYQYSRRYLKQWPNNREILTLLSEAELFLGKKKEAIITLTKLKNLSPYDAAEIDVFIQKLLREEQIP